MQYFLTEQKVESKIYYGSSPVRYGGLWGFLIIEKTDPAV